MPKEDDVEPYQPGSASRSEVRILKANYVEIPIEAQPTNPNDPEAAEFLKLSAAFFAGEKLSPEQLNKVMLRSVEDGGGGNGNCNFC